MKILDIMPIDKTMKSLEHGKNAFKGAWTVLF